MTKSILVSMAVLVMTGCADICAKGDECAKKSGTAFSITECRTSATAERERASSSGCAAEYNAFEACAAGLTCDQLSSTNGLTTNCGAQLEKVSRCLN